jgi:predicted dehydrogenase
MIKIGIIGMGIRGTMFADTIRENPYAEIAAVSEYNEETLQVAVDKYQVAGYQDYIKMMDEVEMDGVIVSTPDFLHKDAVVYAANKGIHILCEKPFSTSVAECEEMVAAIQKNKVKCLVAFENRWNSPVVAAKNNIDSGSVGEILNVNARLNDTIFVPTELLKWSKGSSVGWFLFPHLVDMIAWFSGKTVESVLTVPENALIKQHKMLLETEGIKINFTDEAIDEIATMAYKTNEQTENIGARRLHTIMEKLLEDISFNIPEMNEEEIQIDRDYVQEKFMDRILADDVDRFIL